MGRPVFLNRMIGILFSIGLCFFFGAAVSLIDVHHLKYAINGHVVSRQNWVTYGAPIFIFTGCLCFIVSYGIKNDRSWVKEVALIIFIGNTLFAIFSLIKSLGAQGINSNNWVNVLSSLIGLGIMYWYFYVKDDVVEYYASLKK